MKESELDNMLGELAAQQVRTPDLRANIRTEIERRKVSPAGRLPLPLVLPVFAGSMSAALAIGFVTTFDAARSNATEMRRAETAAALHLNIFSAPASFAPVASHSTPNKER